VGTEPNIKSLCIILENAAESTTSGYCTDNLSVFDDFLLHRMGDTPSAKNHQKRLNYQHINHSRYDSTEFSRIISQGLRPESFLIYKLGCPLEIL
jgi:hypothetical protein